MITALFVILSEGRSPKSKDLRTIVVLCIGSVRRSFDSLRSLRMTNPFRHARFGKIHSLLQLSVFPI